MNNSSLPALIGKQVTLRRPRKEDFASRLRLGNDAEIVRMSGGSRSDVRPMTEEDATQSVARTIPGS
jgi:hypothetical protein